MDSNGLKWTQMDSNGLERHLKISHPPGAPHLVVGKVKQTFPEAATRRKKEAPMTL